ncbi:hypothetical protein ACFL59_05435 [Planctomycetota bacterium]
MRVRSALGAVLAVFVAVTVLYAADVSTLAKELREGLKQGNERKTASALSDLIKEGGKDAAKAVMSLAKKLPAGVAENAYWQLIQGLAEFRDNQGCTYIGDQITKMKSAGLARDLMFALQSNHTPGVLELHRKVLTKGASDLREMSAQQVGSIRLVESVDLLIDVLAVEEKKRRKSDLLIHVERSLERLTGAECGPAHAWRGWWEPRREKGLPERTGGSNTGTVVDRLDPYSSKVLEKMEAKHVLVLTCHCVPEKGEHQHDFDHVENLLSRMNTPHTIVRRKEFEKASYKGLREAWVLLINCTMVENHCVNPNHKAGAKTTMRMHQCDGPGAHKIVNHSLSDIAVKKIKDFVERGGYLFTEDWVLYELLEKAWPALIASYPKYTADPQNPQPKKYLPEMTIDVVPGRGETSNPMMRGIWQKESKQQSGDGESGGGTVSREPPPPPEPDDLLGKHKWVIDEDSPAIVAKDRTTVRVLMASPQLKDHQMSKGNDGVVVTFFPAAQSAKKRSGDPAGRYLGRERLNGGRVLHVISHFGRQVSQEDEFAMQRLLVNFILEANRRVPSSLQGKKREKERSDR